MLGLTAQEVLKQQEIYGLNEIPLPPPDPWWKILIHQFNNFISYLLFVSAIISLLINELIDASLIFIVISANALFGFYQERKALKDIRSLKKLVTPVCRVMRDGKEILLPSKYLVPDDIVIVGSGDKIPADGELIESISLLVNESMLSGESMAVDKHLKDKLYLGTIVLTGHGKYRVTLIGEKTEFGKIARTLLATPDEKTPLEVKIENFTRKLSLFILFFGIVFFIIGLIRGESLSLMFLQTISLVVAAIPEALPAVFTITMAVGVQRMAKRKAIIRKLSAGEGLGSTNIICTDKTGTLTKNEMTVKRIWLINGSEYKATGVGYNAKGEISEVQSLKFKVQNGSEAILHRLIEAGVLCNSSSLAIKEDQGKNYDVLGDTTEGALLILALKRGENIEDIKAENTVVDEASFDTERMVMSVLTQNYTLITKGAPEKVINMCRLSEIERQGIIGKLEEMGREGLRVLAIAEKKINTSLKSSNSLKSLKDEENNMQFLGLVGIYDPPREEVKQTIEIARRAGIRTIMLTGDNPLTAEKIAIEIGLTEEGEEIITSEQLNTYSEEILNRKLDQVNVFARVTPFDKLKIVTAFQNKGVIVAVTGDGINDAPALKKADIGVAMGLTGTDVAKEASDMIITDDNFSTLVRAVEEGRVIYDNIYKAIKYLLSSNLGESLTVIVALIAGLPLPLIPQQILWINLVSDSLPALSLAVDAKDPNVMQRLPRNRSNGLLGFTDWKQLIFIGVIQASLTLSVFMFILNYVSVSSARLIAFSVLVCIEMGVAFFVRGKSQKILSNKTLLVSVGLVLLFQTMIVSIPFLRRVFS